MAAQDRFYCIAKLQMGHFARKPVFGISDNVWLKPACSATETSQNIEMLDEARLTTILAILRIKNVLIRLLGCAGMSMSLLFAYNEVIFLVLRPKCSCEL